MVKLTISIYLFVLSFFGFLFNSKTNSSDITICKSANIDLGSSNTDSKKVSIDSPIETDPNKSYTLPTLTKNNKGEVVLYWTEKDSKNVVSLCYATSKDGKTYSDKKTIVADDAVGNGRLMRPKLLFKKNGEIVAVFSYRTSAAMPPREARPALKQEASHENHDTQAPKQAPRARLKRSSDIRFTVSKDGGNNWTTPMSVDSDTSKLIRGFFDAVVLANDEIAVAYLKDVKGSTKHEERDLRMVVTQNGVFQDERVIDPVVCDCCNISMVVDESGALHMVYRDNNNNIRDMSHIVSKNNGRTFSAPKIIFADNWEINGCPHAGASTASLKNEQYATWYSGTENGTPGFRLVNSSGKLLKVLDESAKNSYLTSDNNIAVLAWEQAAENGTNSIYYSKIINKKLLDTQKVADSDFGQNASVLVYNDKILMAYEVLKEENKTILATKLIE